MARSLLASLHPFVSCLCAPSREAPRRVTEKFMLSLQLGSKLQLQVRSGLEIASIGIIFQESVAVVCMCLVFCWRCRLREGQLC